MEKADQLIKKIDDELLYLHKASLKHEDYYHFNFELALKLLNVEMLRLSSMGFYQIKASQYINVFNDLCNKIVKTISVRFLSFNPTKRILVIEEQEHILGNIESKTLKSEIKVDDVLVDYYSSLKYPTDFNESSKICKFDNVISKCKSVSYDKVDSYFVDIANDNAIVKHLIQNEKFDNFFDIDSNLISKHKITFEKYINDLIEVRALESELNETILIENTANNDKEKIEILINRLIPKFIKQEQEPELRNLLTAGRIKKDRIDIKGSYTEFHNIIYPSRSLIPELFYSSWYDLIVNNFTRNGKDIPKSTISNLINSNKKI
ncbi:MAG: hypothetical protein PHR83_13955 [Paludibacter sp.]|nr:hypothetical protein [Paludibacter sp.]